MCVLLLSSTFVQQECPEEPACLAYGDCVVCQFGTQGTGGRNCTRTCNITNLEDSLSPNVAFDRGTYRIEGSKPFNLYVQHIYPYIHPLYIHMHTVGCKKVNIL